MKTALVSICFALCCVAAFAQSTPAAPATPPPSYANYSIMLVSPVGNGNGVVIMHNPKNILEFVDVSKIQDALSSGYVPVRAVELGELIAGFKEEIARLTAENSRLQGQQPQQASTPAQYYPTPTPAELEAQQRARAAEEKAARRQQIIQSWLMLQAMRPQQPAPPAAQPYQPVFTPPAQNRLQTNCTTNTLGDTAYTNCN